MNDNDDDDDLPDFLYEEEEEEEEEEPEETFLPFEDDEEDFLVQAQKERDDLNNQSRDLHVKLSNGSIVNKTDAIVDFLSKNQDIFVNRYGHTRGYMLNDFSKFIAALDHPTYSAVWVESKSDKPAESDAVVRAGYAWLENNIKDVIQKLALKKIKEPTTNFRFDEYIFNTLRRQKASGMISEQQMLDRAFKALGGMDANVKGLHEWKEFIAKVKENKTTRIDKAAGSGHLNSMPTSQDISMMWKIINTRDKDEVKELVSTLLKKEAFRKEQPFGFDQKYNLILWLRKYGDENVKSSVKDAIREMKGPEYKAMKAAWIRASGVLNTKSAAATAGNVAHATVKNVSNVKNAVVDSANKVKTSLTSLRSTLGQPRVKGGDETDYVVGHGNPIMKQELTKGLLPKKDFPEHDSPRTTKKKW